MKSKVINQVGIVVNGQALLNLWGGGQGEIEMESIFIPNDKITPKNILRCVNDNGFGCESIDNATIEIHIRYDNGSEEYDRTLEDFNTYQKSFFLGWRELREQGIEV